MVRVHLILLGTLPLLIAPAQARGLLRTGFEEPDDLRPEPASWRPYRAWGDQTGQAEWTEDSPRSGDKCIRIRGVTTRLGYASDAVRVDPGEQLRLTAWVKTQWLQGRVSLGIQFYDEAQRTVHVVESDPITGDGDYRRVSLRAMPPEEATWASAMCLVTGPGIVWFDDLRLSAILAEPVWLMDVAAPATVRPGGTLPVVVTVQAVREIDIDDRLSLQLVPLEGGTEPIRAVFEPSPSSRNWPARQSVTLTRFEMRVPDYQPQGYYRIVVDLEDLGLLEHGGQPRVRIAAARVTLPDNAAVRLDLSVPAKASGGRVVKAEIACEFAAMPKLPVAGYVSLLDASGRILYDEIPFELREADDLVGQATAFVGIPPTLPDADYLLSAGLLGRYAVGGSSEAELRITQPDDADGPCPLPMAHGSFVDSQGSGHRWRVDREGLLIWDGAPWFPVGGVVATAFLALAEAGVRDVYFAPACDHPLARPPHVLQQVLDCFERHGMRYGLKIGGPLDEGFRAFRIDPKYVYRGAEAGEARALALDFSPPADGKAVVVAFESDTGTLASVTMEPIQRPLGVDAPAGTVTFTVGERGDGKEYDVHIVPECDVPGGVGTGDIWSNFGRRRARLLGYLSSLSFGPGFRFFLSPLCNDLQPDYRREIPGPATGMPEAFSTWLAQVYASIDDLSDAWALDGTLADFGVAGRLIPAAVRDTAVVLVDPLSLRPYVADAESSGYETDLAAFSEESVAECLALLSDDLKAAIADVPVVVEHQGRSRGLFTATGFLGGPDGVAVRSFGDAEDLPRVFGAAAGAEAALARHSMWYIASQTAPMFGGESRDRGYSSPQELAASLDALTDCGARGLFVLGASLDGIPRLTRNDLSSEPKQLGWLAEHAESMAKRAQAMTRPAFTFVYPPAYRHRFLPAPLDATFRIDGDIGETAPRPAPLGRWAVPAPMMAPARGDFVICLPALGHRREQALSLPELMNEHRGGLVLVGTVANDGTELGRARSYFTDSVIPLTDGGVIQGLRVPEGATVLGSLPDGVVWHLLDGRVEVISRWPVSLDWVLEHSALLGSKEALCPN